MVLHQGNSQSDGRDGGMCCCVKHMGAQRVKCLDLSTQRRVGRGQKASVKDAGGHSQSTATTEEGIWGDLM